jgi:hypothetical protein
MKPRTIVILLALGIGHPLIAGAQTSIGVKVGGAFGTMPATPHADFATLETRTALTVGAYFSLSLSQLIALQPEVFYTQKGTRVTGVDGDPPIHLTAEFLLDYIEVPVLLRLNFGTHGVRPYVMAGPSFNYNIRARVRENPRSDDISDNIANFELALTAGVGVEFGHLLVEGRFSEGITDLVDGRVVLTEGGGVTSRTLSVVAGVRF